jgi:transcriptional regulator with XRE-family HTH domain
MTRQELAARAGAKLRKIRVRLGYSIREVERRSHELAKKRRNRDFFLSRGWIADIENGKFIPGVFKMASLGVLYRLSLEEVHALFGIQAAVLGRERALSRPPKTYLLPAREAPVAEFADATVSTADPAQLEKTNLLSRLIDIWGDVPVPLLRHLDVRRYLYGYIGLEDRRMAPLIPPGSFVQIDAKQTRVKKGALRRSRGQSQFRRPIYFVDIRDAYACGWCQIEEGVLTLVPHPDSPEKVQTFRHPEEAEIVGRVTGVAMRIAGGRLVTVEGSFGRREPPKKP